VKEEYFKRLVFLNPSEIIPPKDARKEYDRYKLFLLSESIRENGLLCPVTVKETEDGYEVISGEKRIKACIMAEVKKIPCIVTDFFDGELFRATEENAGQTVSLTEEADRLNELCKKYSIDTVARTLSFTTGELEKIVKAKGQSEEPKKEIILDTPLKKTDNKENDRKLPPIKDTRFFLNSVRKLVESVKDAGTRVNYRQKETDDSLEIRIKIEKNSVFSQMSLL
jgi:ParB family chromosome partitioning protein